jgi:rod shape-determining protein MreB and related proteins
MPHVRWNRRAPAANVAIDLGTARTRVLVQGRGIVVDEPSLVAYGPPPEGVLQVGDRAWSAAAGHGAHSSWPVRRGVVVDAVGAVHLLRGLLGRAKVLAPEVVVTAVPSNLSLRDKSVLRAVLTSGTRTATVTGPMELASAIGADLDVSDPATQIMVDIGAGGTEVSATGDGRVLAAVHVDVSAGDLACLEPHHEHDRVAAGTGHGAVGRSGEAGTVVVDALTVGLRDVLDQLPAGVAGDLAARPILLSGGGALRAGLASTLSAHWGGARVTLVPRPRDAVVVGLGAMLEQLADLRRRPGVDFEAAASAAGWGTSRVPLR